MLGTDQDALIVGLVILAFAVASMMIVLAVRRQRRVIDAIRSEFPRMIEIRDAMRTPEHPDSFFRDFEGSLIQKPEKRRALLKFEQLLGILDDAGWSDIKPRSVPVATHRVEGRGWQALFDVWNEVRGFKFLRDQGCTNVRFMGRTSSKTPDLEAVLNGRRVLCEVKTFNIADEEAAHRADVTRGALIVRDTPTRLEDGFLVGKLAQTVQRAVAQLDAEDPQRTASRYVFCIQNFNDWVGDYSEEYVAQIDAHLVEHPVEGAHVVMFLPSNLFDRAFRMRAATVLTD